MSLLCFDTFYSNDNKAKPVLWFGLVSNLLTDLFLKKMNATNTEASNKKAWNNLFVSGVFVFISL